MIAYLINATSIWLVSLIAFDLLLKRDAQFGYNRLYLLSTLLLGLVLPLVRVPVSSYVRTQVVQAPLQTVSVAKQQIAVAATPTTEQFPYLLVFFFIYLLGVSVSIALLIKEAVLIISWYRKARKVPVEGYTLVITGREHSPFSVMQYIFLSSLEAYSSTEISFILSHERRHLLSMHSWDKLLVLLVRAAFWMHPLVYVYYKRLMMVHEFEADAAASAGQQEEYGVFLITQQLQGPVPALGHSFNYSPLKTRIRMLTADKTQPWRKLAYAITMPTIMAFGILWVNTSAAHKKERQGNIVLFNGNKFEINRPVINGKPVLNGTFRVRSKSDEVAVQAVEGDGQLKTVVNGTQQVVVEGAKPALPKNELLQGIAISFPDIPARMNGDSIYASDQLSEHIGIKGGYASLLEALIASNKSTLEQLPEGSYDLAIMNLVVDKDGRAVYYDVQPTYRNNANDLSNWRGIAPMNKAQEEQLIKATEDVLDQFSFVPAKDKGTATLAYTNMMGMNVVLVVKDHKVSISKVKR